MNLDATENFSENPQSDSQVINPELDALINSAAEAPTEQEKLLAEYVKAMRNLAISVHDDIPADVNTMCVGNVDTFAKEGLHFVKAKAKQGKTSMLAVLESAYIRMNGNWGTIRRISDEPLKVRHIDTEQKPYDTQCFMKQVFRLAGITEEEAGVNYGIFNLRAIVENEQKKQMIESILIEDHPDVLVIDGIVDLINNFNEVDESKDLIAWLMYLADKYKLVLFCVLHTNKNSMDHNMRGHLGTMSEQKCDTTTECEKDDKSGIVTVKCASSRHCPFPDWSFTWDEDGNLVNADEQRAELARQKTEEQRAERERKNQELKEERKQKMLAIVQNHGGCICRNSLTDLLEKEFGVSRKTISPLITEWIHEGIVFENGKKIQSTPQGNLFSEE